MCQHPEMRDSLGRRRTLEQTRGLRPLQPLLAPGHRSRSIRVAMSERAWAALERATRLSRATTKPRAIGELLEGALGTTSPDWVEWQINKEKQLLGRQAS
jgi:hypothetical protein